MTQCSRNCGLLLGPVLFAIVSYLVKEGLEVSPVCMMGWSMIAAAIMILSGLVLASLAFPSQIPNRKAEEEPPEAMKKAEAEVQPIPPEPRTLYPEPETQGPKPKTHRPCTMGTNPKTLKP